MQYVFPTPEHPVRFHVFLRWQVSRLADTKAKALSLSQPSRRIASGLRKNSPVTVAGAAALGIYQILSHSLFTCITYRNQPDGNAR
ncbi:hypothetical protein NBRC116601_01890 [Cognatishimia sp. WU-CL00825]